MNTITKARIHPNLNKGKGKISYSLDSKKRGRREGIKYQDVCQYCSTTRDLITVRRAGGDLFYCREHAAGGVL